jgi:CheY-like chemotaxis protein
MDGDIDAESVLGSGSTFRFVVAAPLVEATAPEPVRAPLVRAEGKVLVVEDNDVNVHVAQVLLTRLGLDVDVARSGDEALAKVDAHDYALVFMDLRMPGIDGLETSRRIRAGAAPARSVRIAAMTADVGEEARAACVAAGIDDFVAKPIDPFELVAALRRAGLVHDEAPMGPLSTRPLDSLRQLCASRPGAFDELVGEYRAGTVRRLGELRDALARGDRETVHRAAHGLRGAAGTFGHHALGAIAARIESASSETLGLDLHALVDALHVEWSAVAAQLASLVDGADATS